MANFATFRPKMKTLLIVAEHMKPQSKEDESCYSYESSCWRSTAHTFIASHQIASTSKWFKFG
jgi:hypothetical protein